MHPPERCATCAAALGEVLAKGGASPAFLRDVATSALAGLAPLVMKRLGTNEEIARAALFSPGAIRRS